LHVCHAASSDVACQFKYGVELNAMNMPSELRQAVEAAHGGPVEIVDGDRHYVLIQAEVYERLMGVFGVGELSQQERAFLLQQWGKSSGWEDPADDVFDSLKPQ
jgi:hypothetical protein